MKISEHGEQRLHTLYMHDKSSKLKISICTYWKLAEPWQFKQLQNTAPQALIDGANIWTATWLYNIVLSENLASWILHPWSLKLKTWSSCLETRSLHLETRSIHTSRWEDRVSSFKLWVSQYSIASSLTLLTLYKKDQQIDQFRYIKIHTWLRGLGE